MKRKKNWRQPYKTWMEIPDDGRTFLIKVPGIRKWQYAYWRHAMCGGKPIIGILDAKGTFLWSFFANDSKGYGKDWYALPL